MGSLSGVSLRITPHPQVAGGQSQEHRHDQGEGHTFSRLDPSGYGPQPSRRAAGRGGSGHRPKDPRPRLHPGTRGSRTGGLRPPGSIRPRLPPEVATSPRPRNSSGPPGPEPGQPPGALGVPAPPGHGPVPGLRRQGPRLPEGPGLADARSRNTSGGRMHFRPPGANEGAATGVAQSGVRAARRLSGRIRAGGPQDLVSPLQAGAPERPGSGESAQVPSSQAWGTPRWWRL